MRFEHDTLAKVCKQATYEISFKLVGPVVKKSIIKALNTGIITSTSGDTALYHSLLVEAHMLPSIAYSKRGRYWDCLFATYINDDMVEHMQNWWMTDRVTFRMEKPDEYAAISHSWRKNQVEEPDWQDKTFRDQKAAINGMTILSQKNVSLIEQIMTNTVATQQYKDLVAPIINLVQSNGSFTVVKGA